MTDTPELAQLYRRAQRFQTLAQQYQGVLDGLPLAALAGDPTQRTVTFHTTAFARLPQSIPLFESTPDGRDVRRGTRGDGSRAGLAARASVRGRARQTYRP
jgi:hypothetical protein